MSGIGAPKTFPKGSTYDEVPDKPEETGFTKTISNFFSSLFDSGADEDNFSNIGKVNVTPVSLYETDQFAYDPTRYTRGIDIDRQDARIDNMLYNRSDDPGYKRDEYAGSTYDEVLKQIKPEKAPVEFKDAVNESVRKGIMATTPTGTYKIQGGDTLGEIAAAAGTTVDFLKKLNKIENENIISAGADLKIPVQTTAQKEVVSNATSMKELATMKDYKPTQSGVPMDQRDFAPEGEPYVPPEMTPPENAPGNNVDFDFISDQEGRAINNGYVPTRRDGTVVDQSGVTVGTGVDLGSKNDAYFDGLDESIKAKIRPHFGKKRTAAQTSLQTNPLRLTDSEVATLDRFVKEKELDTLRDKWNEDSDTDFDDLPTNQATAVASTYYQYGQQMFDHNYWDQTTSGDWEAARDNLRNYGDNYNSRRNREATYLESGEM